MATLEQRNHARSFLRKAEEYLASAEVNLEAGATPSQPGTPSTRASAPRTPS